MWGSGFRKGIPTLSLFLSPRSSKLSPQIRQAIQEAGVGDKFILDETDQPPTKDQLQTIGNVVSGSKLDTIVGKDNTELQKSLLVRLYCSILAGSCKSRFIGKRTWWLTGTMKVQLKIY